MSIDMTFELNKSEPETHFHLSTLFWGLLILALLLLFIWGGLRLLDADTLPIRQVRIEGDFTRLSPVDLKLLVTDKVRGSFFDLDVNKVRLTLLEDPWVYQVTVKRIWPDTLRVIVIEQTPIVRWGDKGLLNPAGEYFEPNSKTIPQNLPVLSGPEGSTKYLLGEFHMMQKKVQATGFEIASLTLDERRSWSFILKKGIVIILGRRNFTERFNRFLSLIPTTLLGRIEQTESIDMRYTNGFSIRWKNNNIVSDLLGE